MKIARQFIAGFNGNKDHTTHPNHPLIYISGSLAYDRIMDFPGKFSDHILPEKIHILNVSFAVNGLTEQFGGTAGNIAYSLSLLGVTSRRYPVETSVDQKALGIISPGCLEDMISYSREFKKKSYSVYLRSGPTDSGIDR